MSPSCGRRTSYRTWSASPPSQSPRLSLQHRNSLSAGANPKDVKENKTLSTSSSLRSNHIDLDRHHNNREIGKLDKTQKILVIVGYGGGGGDARHNMSILYFFLALGGIGKNNRLIPSLGNPGSATALCFSIWKRKLNCFKIYCCLY